MKMAAMWRRTRISEGSAFAVLIVAAFASATPPTNHRMDDLPTLLNKIKSSRSDRTDPKFDCAWRRYAYEYAPQIMPRLHADPAKMKRLFDALELQALCQQNFSLASGGGLKTDTAADAQKPSHRGEEAPIEVYVDPVQGRDNNTGTSSAPLQTIAGAVAATRQRRKEIGDTAQIWLLGGVYHLPATIELGPQDSGLSITAVRGQHVVISGGRHITNVEWSHGTTPKGAAYVVTDLSAQDLPEGVPAMHYGDPTNRQRATRARFPNANPELDLFPAGYITEKVDWTLPTFDGVTCDSSKQCGKSVNLTFATPPSEWHGMYQNWTTGVGGACDVYNPPRSPWCSGDFYLERQFPEMHTRHPSGVNPGATLPHAPYADAAGAIVHAWRPGHWYSWMFEVAGVDAPTPPVTTWQVYDGENNIYNLVPSPGKNSSEVLYLGKFNTANECWAACNASRIACNDWTWHHLDFSADWAGECFTRLNGTWGPTAQQGVTSARGPHQDPEAFIFGRGGNQGGEGNDAAAEFWIDNVFEELDADNEFFFDPKASKLYFIPNGTDAPDNFVVPTLANFFSLLGTQQNPVKNVSISGATFTASRPTYMEPRGNPSGGDWALERMGAVLLEGTEHALVHNNTFVRLDSNAIFLSGYNQYAVIDANDFSWLGQNCIASWGKAVDNDGTTGEFPRYTTVSNNWAHEIGIIQKQSSFYFQAETAQTTLEGNIVFNIPRAAINFNDGFGGGSTITNCLLFNTCRESSDHGAFNSWDRLPYITTVRDGITPSTIPAVNDVHHNFIVANYAADGGCLDNDDGSSYYDIHHNFCVFGGHKSDFDGNSKVSRFNIHAYPNVYGIRCLDIGAQVLPPKGYAESYHDNTCILPDSGDTYLFIQGLPGYQSCLTPDSKATFEDGMILGNNTIYVPDANPKIICANNALNFSAFQQQGYDKTSTVSGDMPSADTIVGWAKTLLSANINDGGMA
eukprot:m.639093 g.639093  ORF g.639093 m.639093 type:complete len:968 (-) comp22611_c1_seq2:259-3162(-)